MSENPSKTTVFSSFFIGPREAGVARPSTSLGFFRGFHERKPIKNHCFFIVFHRGPSGWGSKTIKIAWFFECFHERKPIKNHCAKTSQKPFVFLRFSYHPTARFSARLRRMEPKNIKTDSHHLLRQVPPHFSRDSARGSIIS